MHPAADRPRAAQPTHRFSVLAAAEASVMSRALELFAKRGLVPERVDARRADPDQRDRCLIRRADRLENVERALK